MLLRAGLTLHLVDLALRLFSFARVWSAVQRRISQVARPRGTAVAPERIGWAVTRVSRPILNRDSCLAQACTAGLLLARHGYPATIHLGVRREGEGVGAHAWTTVGELMVVGGHQVESFQPLPQPTSERP